MTQLTDPSRLIRALRDLGDLDGGRRDLAGVLGRTAALARETLQATWAYAAVAVDKQTLVASAREGLPLPRTEPWSGPGTLGLRVIEEQEPILWTGENDIEEPSAHDRIGLPAPGVWMGIPLRLPMRARGLLAALAPSDPRPGPFQLETAELIAGHAETAVGNLLTYQRAEALALTDELTRLYNFRFLKTALKREMERAARYGQVFSIIMIDVDHLKRYNDKHGHLGGSELLRQLAGILSRSSRAIDLVAKYGGDEFLIILPQTRLEGAYSMANRLRIAVAETAFPHCRPGDMTISVGVASFPQHGDTVKSLVASADAALFRAKRRSRNCVVAADPPGTDDDLSDAA